MQRFPSKIGLELAIPLALLLGSMLIVLVHDKEWVNTAIVMLISAFIAHPFFSTYYQIEGNTLRVKCGIFTNKSIDIQSIKKIAETRNPAGAPAVSLDRLKIAYNRFDAVLVSPKDKQLFIDELLRIKPDINVQLRL